MDLRQQMLFEAQQQTDAMSRIIELLKVLTSPAEVAGFLVAASFPFEELELDEPAPVGPTVIQPEPVAVAAPRQNLFSRLFG